jgi:hypothetical protein
MNLRRMLLISAAIIAINIASGFDFRPTTGVHKQFQASACQKCGDGYCARSCENAQTCPRDCGGTGGTTE